MAAGEAGVHAAGPRSLLLETCLLSEFLTNGSLLGVEHS